MSVEVNGILVAAHELKAPLSLMRQLALSLELAPEAEQPRLKSQLVGISERALRQVNDLTKIARLEDGLFNMEPVSVRGVCEAVWRELASLYRFERRDLRPIYANRAKLAYANRDLLYSVIYNFCANALHYSDTETTSQLAVRDYHGCIRVSVRDFGPALPFKIWQELHSQTFDHPTDIAMRSGSSGLGLYIASKFSGYMQAEIGAIRHRDGTSFFVDLPISRQVSLWQNE